METDDENVMEHEGRTRTTADVLEDIEGRLFQIALALENIAAILLEKR